MYLSRSSIVSGLSLVFVLAQSVFSAHVHDHAHKHALRASDGHHINYAHTPFHRRRPARDIVIKRDVATAQLQTEITAFTKWMDTFFDSSVAFNTKEAVAKVTDEMKVHGEAMKAFVTAASANSAIPESNVVQLQMEIDSFKTWADVWGTTAPLVDSDSARYVLKQDVVSYEGWLNQWIAANGGSGSGSAPAPPSPPASAPSPPAPVQPSPPSQVSPPASPIEKPNSEAQAVSPKVHTTFIVSPPAAKPTVEAPPVDSKPQPQPVPAPENGASNPGADTKPKPQPQPDSSSSSGASPKPQSQPQPDSGNGGFNPGAETNLAAWWGQTPAASEHGLEDLCNDPNYDIVIISFLTDFFFGPGGYPKINFGPASGTPSDAQIKAGATGLFDASHLVPTVQKCQSSGKKVMLSIGGAIANSKFADDSQAETFADTVWNLFLGGTSPLRPFGSSVQLDGIDIDNENHDPTGYVAFTKALRSKINSSQRKYYISAAPQCPLPDASIPIEAMPMMDFVWVQFYNNPSCNHGAQGFLDSVKNWSKGIAAGSADGKPATGNSFLASDKGGPDSSGPKLFVAAIADPGQGSGFLTPDALKTELEQVKQLGLDNFGGYALWDGSYAIQNGGMMKSVKSDLVAR